MPRRRHVFRLKPLGRRDDLQPLVEMQHHALPERCVAMSIEKAALQKVVVDGADQRDEALAAPDQRDIPRLVAFGAETGSAGNSRDGMSDLAGSAYRRGLCLARPRTLLGTSPTRHERSSRAGKQVG